MCVRSSPFLSYHGACPWWWRSCSSCGQACLLCSHASSRVDGLQREGGGCFSWRFLGRRVLWRGGVVYFVLLVYPWSFHPRLVRGGGFGPVLPRHTLLVLFVPSGLWFVCLVAVVCSPVTCGSLLSVLWGCLSYHHFFLHGLPIRYFLIPVMFRSSVLAASCSSCVLWRCPDFLRRWRLPPALMAYGEREEGGFHGAFSVGGCAGVAALCTLFS